jgi:WD40 repeat protein
VRGVGFSRDGRSLASGSADQQVRVWDVESRQLRTVPLSGHDAPVTAVAFTPDGGYVASSSGDATARLWDIGFSSWAAAGCELINRNMTLNEWNELIPDVPYERTCPQTPSGDGAPRDAPALR